MSDLFLLLSIFSFLAIVTGLIKPSLVVRWGTEEKKNRIMVLAVYGVSVVVFFFLFNLTSPAVETDEVVEPYGYFADLSDEEFAIYEDMKGEIIMKSDKDVSELKEFNPREVRNCSTGNFMFDTMAESVTMEDYALSYMDKYFEEDEVHYIINFTYKTTTQIRQNGGRVEITVMEYVDKEEHDANTIGTGMILKEYIMYPDGDIEELNYDED